MEPAMPEFTQDVEFSDRVAKVLDQAMIRLEVEEAARREPLAVIGMSCRFPGGASSPEEFWELLASGRDGFVEVPPDRWNIAAFYDPDPSTPGKMHVRRGGFIADVDRFAADFFEISPREAESLDPQHRLLLEATWEALERAGEPPASLKGQSVGVFIGQSYQDYSLLQLRSNSLERIGIHSGTGVGLSMASGRISHFLGVHGPCLTLDTACSSSLMALHLATRSLRARESNLAIVGGCQLMLAPDSTICLCKVGALGTNPTCRAFDSRANGMVRGEGCGVVILKRASDARRDGNPILAMVRGTATHHDGASSGLTVPNPNSQKEAILRAHADGGTSFRDVAYVEAHGTGTPLGDPIELQGLALAAAASGARLRPLRLGSVKNNIGHLEAAAGMAGLIKVILMLDCKAMPPHIHCDRLTQSAAWESVPLRLAQAGDAWPEGALAGLSSFGFSGANVHVVLSGPPENDEAVPAEESDGDIFLLPASARSREELDDVVRRYRDGLTDAASVGDFCHTAGIGRNHWKYRAAFLGARKAELLSAIDGFLAGEQSARVFGDMASEPPRIAIACSEKARLSAAAAKDLARAFPVFAECLAREGESVSRDGEAISGSLAGRALLELWKSFGVTAWAAGGGDTVLSLGEECPPPFLDGGTDRMTILRSLARLYVAGQPISWQAVNNPHGSRRRMTMPTYPFRRRRYWVSLEASPFYERRGDELEHRLPAAAEKGSVNAYYALEWRDSRLEARRGRKREAAAWLLMTSPGAFGDALAASADGEVFRILAGESFAVAERAITVRPDEPADYRLALATVRERLPGVPLRIVHAWSAEARPKPDDETDALRTQRLGSESLMFLYHAMLDGERPAPCRLWCVTSRAIVDDTSSRAEIPWHAPMWGMARTITLERSESWGGIVDVDLDDPTAAARAVIEECDAEDGEDGEDQIIRRKGVRRVPRLVRLGGGEMFSGLNPEKIQWVTGGTGALGLHVAQWLADHGASRLLLTARRSPSPEALRTVERLRERGVRVEIRASDVASEAEVRDVVRAAGGELGGVFHLAGVEGFQGSREIEAADYLRVLQPKLAGTWLLHCYTKDLEIEHFVAFSSIAALWGSQNQLHYAAANAFLDELCAYRRSTGLPALSVQWGPWSGGGMTTAEGLVLLERIGIRGMEPGRALEGLGRAIARGDARVVIADLDERVFRVVFNARRRRRMFDELSGGGTEPAAMTPPAVTARDRDLESCWGTVRAEVLRVVGLDPSEVVDPHAGYFDMGMDSMMMVELHRGLEKAFGLTLTAAFPFNYPSIAASAGQIAKLLGLEARLPIAGDACDRACELPARGELEELLKAELRELDRMI
jgi:acyl transferase domain-containing protein